jgi:hypothetical protein
MRRIIVKLVFVLLSAFSFCRTEAQVSVILYPEPAKQFFIDDVWKTILINASTKPETVIIQWQIKTGGSQDVLTVTTQAVTLAAGSNSLNATESASAKWDYGNTSAAAVLRSTGKLSYGQYTLGVSVMTLTGKLIGSNSEELDIQPMLPPQLSSPRNEDTVTVKYPLLTWIPPRPVVSGVEVTYSLRLVALQKGQSPAEGLLQNEPLLNLTGLATIYTTYPGTAQELQPGVNYAWQVSASYEGYSLGTTEIWTFTLKPPPPPPADDVIYPVASKVSDGHFYVTKGIIRFAYNNSANDKKLNYVIKRLDKKVNLKSLPDLEVKPGTNKLEIDLRHNAGLKEKEYYDLVITDSKGQVYRVMFYYITQ